MINFFRVALDTGEVVAGECQCDCLIHRGTLVRCTGEEWILLMLVHPSGFVRTVPMCQPCGRWRADQPGWAVVGGGDG